MKKTSNDENNLCEFHSHNTQFLCSCKKFICFDCIPIHCLHENFELRNRDNIYKDFIEELNNFTEKIDYIRKSINFTNFDLSIICLNRDHLNNFFEDLGIETQQLMNEVQSLINISDPKSNTELQMINFLFLKLNDKLTLSILKKSKKIIEIEKTLDENSIEFMNEYYKLLKKYFPINKINNHESMPNSVDLITKNFEDFNIQDSHFFKHEPGSKQVNSRNYEENNLFTNTETNRLNFLKSKSTFKGKYKKKCQTCNKSFEVESTKKYYHSCGDCYKINNKNK